MQNSNPIGIGGLPPSHTTRLAGPHRAVGIVEVDAFEFPRRTEGNRKDGEEGLRLGRDPDCAEKGRGPSLCL